MLKSGFLVSGCCFCWGCFACFFLFVCLRLVGVPLMYFFQEADIKNPFFLLPALCSWTKGRVTTLVPVQSHRCAWGMVSTCLWISECLIYRLLNLWMLNRFTCQDAWFDKTVKDLSENKTSRCLENFTQQRPVKYSQHTATILVWTGYPESICITTLTPLYSGWIWPRTKITCITGTCKYPF